MVWAARDRPETIAMTTTLTRKTYIVWAYCGGPAQTTCHVATREAAREQADRWYRDMPEAHAIVVYGPRKTRAGDYEVYRVRGQASER